MLFNCLIFLYPSSDHLTTLSYNYLWHGAQQNYPDQKSQIHLLSFYTFVASNNIFLVLCCVVLLCKLPALTDRPPTKIVFFIWEVELKFRCSSFSHRISFNWTLRTAPAQPSRQIISFCLPTVFADLWWHIEKINIESVRVYLIIYYFICFPKQFCGVTRVSI